ncbi:2-amino-4-hydroxy-6-hydroxymethyldihydropteridine diphosphokinase [Leekyejoonella antrihumi]|uniref:Bifunctional folate synthesis protein n=2 Tax=Leekyejoonella antrihumi TaxID=1660198 RepID=A0A563DTV5_9MICO|nr:2-amino-4-hydroxy-6-hydroxymethyldihydropteridine diphosphokinase [Leekyejoonella antrihumi]
MAADRIILNGITVTSCHGVLPQEKTSPQRFIADIVLECDLSRAGHSDDLAHTVSYAEIAQEAEAILRGPTVDLIETLAQRIADTALTRVAVEAVEVTIHKPQAPAGVVFHDGQLGGPAVRIRREQDRQVVIACGANLGDREATLSAAVRALDRTPGIQVVAVSPLVETDPVGGPDQPDYLNAVVIARSRLAPLHLLGELHRIESWHHRIREVRWGARTLDLDLIQVGDPDNGSDLICATNDLTLPHPRAAVRGFVLVPWSQVDPAAALRCGDTARPVLQILGAVDVSGVRSGPPWWPL